jgi:hypothetical protein
MSATGWSGGTDHTYFLQKPYKPEQLAEKVEFVLSKARGAAEPPIDVPALAPRRYHCASVLRLTA